MIYSRIVIIWLILLFSCTLNSKDKANQSSNYNELEKLFLDWRNFENPPLLNGAPNYTRSQFDKSFRTFKSLKKRLKNIDTTKWLVHQKVDWQIVLAEMNGYDFNYRVLKPWERDPAFYQTVWMYESDVPAHEGPTNHAVLEFWSYNFPLTAGEEKRLEKELSIIPSFLLQARRNLIGNARDLWVAGIENIKEQEKDLDFIKNKIGHNNSTLFQKLDAAKISTSEFRFWLEKEAPSKSGPSGIGKENYTWYQQNVHLLPFTWEEEVDLLQRELDRAWASLKLEEHRNKDLPKLKAANNSEEFSKLTEKSIVKMMTFLKEKDIMPIKSNMEPALRKHMGNFVPEKDRNFFYIGMHYDPLPLYSHFYHWFDLAQVRDEPHKSIIRRGPLLYNIFDSKNEGIATGVEEMFMHAGLYDDNPRSREIVWIMLAQRAARGLGSLYAHANEMTMAEAGQVHVKWTPRGWMEREPHLLQFEQHLYLRQPGYGTCYVTGKYLIERLIAEYAEIKEKEGQPFVMKDFMEEFNNTGNIPVELLRWDMTKNRPEFLNWYHE
ncbi:MAG: hypothetical protein CMG55_02815 [Candidatus Marinimicrobia bacterium]|nr:hypothetical protein [Candidatus Neomarinimicrobiota bacterium]